MLGQPVVGNAAPILVLHTGWRRLTACALVGVVLAVASLVTATSARASALAPGDTELVSTPTDPQAFFGAVGPSVTADGRYVAFGSDQTTIHPGADWNGTSPDAFVRDRLEGTMGMPYPRSALESGPVGVPVLATRGSGSIMFVTPLGLDFRRDENKTSDVYFAGGFVASVNPLTGNAGNGPSRGPALSPDGVLAFASDATDLVANDENGSSDIYLKASGLSYERVSVDTTGGDANGDSHGSPALSTEGRRVAFSSAASDLVLDDGNAMIDVFLRDREAGRTERVSVDTSGGDPNGRSSLTNQGISDDGRYVAFTSAASDLVPGDTNGVDDVFVRYVEAGTTRRVSVDSIGVDANGASSAAAISPDGRYVAFTSTASDLVAGDTNAVDDVFIRDLLTNTTVRASLDSGGRDANRASGNPALSENATYIVFDSQASDLVSEDDNHVSDVYIRRALPNRAPVAAASSVETPEDTEKTFALAASDADADAVTYAVTDAPDNGSVECAADGACRYMPHANFNGTDSFKFKATDAYGGAGAATVTITVRAVNDAPVAQHVDVTAREDTASSFNLRATDVDGGGLTYTLLSFPATGALTCDPDGACTYRPEANVNGSVIFDFRVVDIGGATDDGTGRISIEAVNDAPVASDGEVATDEDTPRTFNLQASDVDAGDQLSYAVVEGPQHGAVECNASGSCEYRPDADYNGLDELVFRVRDRELAADDAQVRITVRPVNDRPTADDLSVTLAQETSAEFALMGSDVDGDALSYAITENPAHGTVTCDGALCRYVPDPDYFGADAIAYSVTDPGRLSATARVTITIGLVTRPTTLEVPNLISLRAIGLRVTVPFVGTLTRTSNGAAVAGRRVTFVAAGRVVCSAMTDATGRASCSSLLSLPAVLLGLGYTAVFDGDVQYNASSDTGRLVGS